MVISLSIVKTMLGLSDTTYDTQITAQLPIIDAKVKQICRNTFHKQIFCKTTADSDEIIVYGSDANLSYQVKPLPDVEMLLDDLPTGTTISGTGIPADSYISEVYYESGLFQTAFAPYFVLNANVTEGSNTAYLYAGINIAYWPVISKGIWWLISQTSTTLTDDTWISKSFGPVSVTKGGSEKLDGKSGMPLWFVRSLPRYM